MTQKNETPALVLSLLITAGLLGAGFWWLTRQQGSLNFGANPTTPQTDNAPDQQVAANAENPPQSTGEGFAQVQNVPSGLFRYGGSSSWAPLRLAVDSAIQVARPEFRLQYADPVSGAPGSGAGIRMLNDGQIAFAQSSRPVMDEEYQQAQNRGAALKQIAVAIDGLAVAVNPSLNIPGLTIDQLKGIYTGQINNWNQVGGPNLAITPISRDAKSGGTVELFIEQVLNQQPFSNTVQIVSTTTQALQKLGSTPGGIYFASAPEVVPQCSVKPLPIGRALNNLVPPYQGALSTQCPTQRNQLNIQAFQDGSYPLIRNLFVIVKQNGQREQQAGEAYANLLLTDQGQDAIAQAGFVRVR